MLQAMLTAVSNLLLSVLGEDKGRHFFRTTTG